MPNPAPLPCPGREELHRLLLGLVQLSDDDARRWEEHLTVCARCDRLAQELAPADGLVEAMQAQPAAVEHRGTAVRQLIARLKELSASLGPAGETPSRQATPQPGGPPQESFDFLTPPQGPDELGRLGPYRVLRVLGQGGMGVVFEAEDLQLGRRVALKAIRPALLARISVRERFLHEARATAALEHDHIVAVYQVGEDHDVPFLVMPLLQGETLEARLEREGRLSVTEILRIGRQTAEGLAAAHAKGLIHQDVKPSNIFLTEVRGPGATAEAGTGPRTQVKLLDFGLAHAADDLGPSQQGLLLGTPHFMAPEQAEGGLVDARADLFSLGCVLYRAATGALPFHGSGTAEILSALAVGTPRPPHALNPALPRRLSDLIVWLLAKAPADRPPSAAAVAGELAALEQRWALARRNRRRGLLIAAGLLAAALGWGVYAYRGKPIDRAPPENPPVVERLQPSGGRPADVSVVHEVRRFEGHADGVWSVAFSPDGRRAASASAYRFENRKFFPGSELSVRVWDVASGQQLHRLTVKDSRQFVGVAFSREGHVLATGNNLALCEWHADTGQQLRLVRGNAHWPILTVAYSADRKRFLTAHHEPTVTLWDAESNAEPVSWEGHAEAVLCAAFAPDGRRVLIGGGGQSRAAILRRGTDYSIRLWDLQGRTEGRRFVGHTAFVWSLAFAPDGDRFISGSLDGTLRVWDVRTGAELHRLPAGGVRCVAFCPDGHRALTGNIDGIVRLWDVRTGQLVCRFEGHSHTVYDVACSPDGRFALSGGEDTTVRLWPLPENESR